jgi:hypothetical protein
MLYYRKYDHGFTSTVLTKDEFDALKSRITADPNTYPFPSSSSSQYRKDLWAEVKDMYAKEIRFDFVLSFGGLVLAVILFFAVSLIEKMAGFSNSGVSWFFGLILFVVILKVLAHVVGVIISVINFTTYFNTKKWFYGQVYEMIRYYPDHESYLGAYRQSRSPVSDRMIT